MTYAKRAGVKFDAHYALTTVDPPELVHFIQKQYPDAWTGRKKPKMSMWELIPKQGILPTRKMRYCCAVLKESNGKGRTVITGIRHAESTRRAKRKMTEPCNRGGKLSYLHPIIDWSTDEVWEYIKTYNVPYCSLYDEGKKRIGCIACPFASSDARRADLERWPKYKTLYLQAITKMQEKRKSEGKKMIASSPEEEFEWWMGKHIGKADENQTMLFGIIGDESML